MSLIWPKIFRVTLAGVGAAVATACGEGLNNIDVKTAKETSAEHCEARGKCVKDPKGLILYNPELVTGNNVVKQDASDSLLTRAMNLIDEPKLLVVSQKIEPLIRGVAVVGEYEPCDSPRGIDGSNPTAGSLRQLKEGRYKTCLVYMGEGYLKRILTLDPINVDTTPPDVAGGVSVSGISANSGFISWSKAGDNVTLDGDLSYVVYVSTDRTFRNLDDVRNFGNPLPGKILGSTSYGMTSLLERKLYHAAVVVRDEAGNESLVGTANFTTPPSDVTAPTVAITSNRDPGPTNITSLYLTIRFSEAVSGFDASDVQVVGGTKGELTANDASTYTLAVNATGSLVSASIPANVAEDSAGNKSLASGVWSITINGAAASTVASPAAGIYTSPTSVTLSTTTPDATIHYTVDNTTPTASSSVYTSAITVASTQTIKTLVVAPNYNPSVVTSHGYTITGTVQAPTFSVSSGSYGLAQSVALSTATAGASIYYTTNGETPTSSSTPYSSPITVTTSQTIKAIATKANFSDSAVASAAYTINGAVATPTASPAAGIYTTAQSVTLSSATAGATIYYTLDGSTPTTSSTPYSTPVFLGVSQTIKAIAVKSAFVDSNVGTFGYTITGTVQAPTFSVAAGAYGPAQTVTLSSATPGATIYYTTNGSDPTTSSTQYSGAITVSASQTIKAFAVLTNWADSAVAMAAYTINGAVATPTFSVAAGAYGPAQTVTLSTTTAGATIYYTTDGSDPTTSSTQYSGAITVSSSQTLKAFATEANFSDSAIASAAYTINGAVATPTFSVAAGAYGPAQTVTLNTATAGSTIYYTTNGTDPTTASAVYSSAITVSSTSTIKAFATKADFSNSAIASAAYTINGTVATPTFSVSAGAYGPAQTVTLSTTTAGATIYYTTNGTDPTTASAVYSTAITVSSTSTIKAFATKADFSNSAIASAAYTINGTVDAPTASTAAGIYTTAQSVTLSSATAGASIYYTLDGSTPTTSSTPYSTAIFIGVSQTIKAIAVKSAFVDSNVGSFAYTITGTVQAPTFSVAAGAYGPAQTVTLSSATPGATIYYTTNGSDPTTSSTQYSGAITVSASQTIKAFAVLANWADSSVASAAYTINGAVATPTFSVSAGAYGPAQTVTLSTTTAGATIYYTTNGVDPTTASTVYSSAITVSSTSTIKAFATKANFSDSAIASAAYTINGAVATPTASPAAGIYTTAQSVTLSSATAGASIYYTLDGSTPTTSSTPYSTAIFIGVSQTIKAIAVKSAFVDSNVGSFGYTITGTVQTPTFSVSAGAYGPAQTVTLSSATPGATIYYTTNGSNPTTSSTQYSAPITVSTSQTIKAFAVLTNWADSSVASAAYTINGAVATPTFSVSAGAYGPAQSVTLSTTTAGATIYYTTNGTDPTTASTVYSSAITVSSTSTIKAFATKADFSNSAIASAAYTINGAVATPTFSVAAGAYGPAQSVTLSTTTAGATIYYTTNGTDPTTSSTQYSGAITVSSSQTLKAFATKANFSNSAIASAAYTINGAVATPTFSVAAGAYGPAQTVTLSTTTAGATIYYTTNGSDPTTSSAVYSSPITVSKTLTLKAFATKSDFSNSSIGSAAYTIISGDPDFSSVSLLLHMDGTNGSTSFVDSGPNALSVTASGSAQISTSQSKFGGASASYSGGAYNQVASNSLLSFGTGDFTVELWLRFNSLPAAQASIFDIVTPGGFSLYYTSTQYYAVPANNLVVSDRQVGQFQNYWLPSVNTWYHVAVSRSGTSMRVFIDGTQLGSTVTASTNYAQGVLQIGNGLDAFIDDVRATKGVARYTANFTVPSAPFADQIGSANGGGVTGANSAYRLQSSDILIPPTAALSAPGDYTVEFWVSYDVGQTYWSAFWDGGNFGFLARNDSGMKWRYFYDSNWNAIDSKVIANKGLWQHVAFVRQGTSVRNFVNGILQSSATTTVATTNFTGADRGAPIAGYSTVIGRGGPPYYPYGDNYVTATLSGFNIAKVARYTSDFVPARLLTNDANTLMFLAMPETGTATLYDAGPLAIAIATNNVSRVAGVPTPPGFTGAGTTASPWVLTGTAVSSCLDIRQNTSLGPAATEWSTVSGSGQDGVYTITVSSTNYNVYCDMTTNGGGWTLMASAIGGSTPSAAWATATTGINVANIGDTTQTGRLPDSVINAVKGSKGRFTKSAGTSPVFFATTSLTFTSNTSSAVGNVCSDSSLTTTCRNLTYFDINTGPWGAYDDVGSPSNGWLGPYTAILASPGSATACSGARFGVTNYQCDWAWPSTSATWLRLWGR